MAPGDIGLLKYIAVLEADAVRLERELADVKNAVKHAKRVMASQGQRAALPGADEPVDPPKSADGPYAGRGVEESALEYLSGIPGVPKKTAEIARALLAGGIETEAKNFNSTVFGSLRRLAEKGEIEKAGKGRWVRNRKYHEPVDDLHPLANS